MFANVREKIIYLSVPCIHNVYKKPELYNRTSILIQEDAFTSVCIKTSFTPFFCRILSLLYLNNAVCVGIIAFIYLKNMRICAIL